MATTDERLRRGGASDLLNQVDRAKWNDTIARVEGMGYPQNPAAPPAPKPNSFGDAAAAAQDRSVTQVGTGTPAASSPAAPAGGLQGVADRVSQIPTGGLKAPAPDGSQSSWANTDVGRNVTNAAMALPGVAGAVPAVAQTGGAISSGLSAASRLMNIGAATAGASAVPMPASAEPAPAGRQPLPAGVTPSTAAAGRGSINPPMADPNKPLPLASDPQPAAVPGQSGYGPIGDRTTLSNEQAAAMNPAGRITVTRGANGTMEFSGGNVSGQVSYNDASGKALPGGGLNGKGFSAFDVAPAGARLATGPNGSYAFDSGGGQYSDQAGGMGMPANFTGQPSAQNLSAAQRLSDGQGLAARAMQQQAQQQQPGFSGVIGQQGGNGNMWSRTPEQQRRDAEVQASSIHRPTAMRGALAMRALDAQDLEGVRGANALEQESLRGRSSLAQEALRQDGGLQREGMQQGGANARAVLSSGIDQQRVGIEQERANIANRAARQLETQRAIAIDPRSTPEQRSAAERALMTLQEKQQQADPLVVVPGGDHVDSTGQRYKAASDLYNRQTGQWIQRPGQGGGQAPQYEVGKVYINGKGEKARRTESGWAPA